MKFTTAQALFNKAGGKRTGSPAWCYNNAELTQLELEQVFLRNWIWIGHVSDIPNGGDYRCLDQPPETGNLKQVNQQLVDQRKLTNVA